MRAAIVYDCLYPYTKGGGERVYRRIAEILVERGFEVDYVTRAQWSGAVPDEIFHVVPVWAGEIADEHGTRSTVAALRFARAAAAWIRPRRDDFDIVIASALPVLTLIAVRIALGRRPRAFLVGDWLEVWAPTRWRAYAGVIRGSIAAALQRLAARVADLNTVNSGFTAVRLEQEHPRGEVLVLGLVDLIDGDDLELPAATPPYVLVLGRHIPDKRIDLVPAALRRAREQIPDLHAVIAGDGPERDRILRMIHAAGADPWVRMPGFVDDDDLPGLIGSASALVNPSSREGFGLVVVEAAARGVPTVLIAGDDNAAVDLIEDGVNGLVAADADALGAAIVDVVRAGEALRVTTRAWYERARVEAGLGVSIDRVLSIARAQRPRSDGTDTRG